MLMMKTLSLLPLLLAPALALPTIEHQTVFDALGGYTDLAGNILSGVVHGAADLVHKVLDDGKKDVNHNELNYEIVSHPSFAEYKLRIMKPKLCDPSVKQYSGYLDISEDKHLFFWFFESRTLPDEDPLVLWLNGGPGCSSSAGLLFELGPCSVTNNGLNTTRNKYSWNKHANMIFLDQPVNVGYSYATDGTTVKTSPVAGKDVYAFLELFLHRFPKYATAPFHVAAESYGGTYGPNIVNVIHKRNKQHSLAPIPDLKKINLASLILANGLTDPYIQMGSVADYACDGPYPLWKNPKGPECNSLRSKIPTCQRLIKSCYNFQSKLTCVPASLYCNSQLFGPIMQTGKNPYDVRRACNRDEEGDLCYKQMEWVETWMNDVSHKKALGVPAELDFVSCNMDVNRDFQLQGDGMHNSAALLPEIIDEGVRLLVYAGNADMMCNYIGNKRWVTELPSKFHDEFADAATLPWELAKSGKLAGTVRSAGGGGFTAGNITFINVHKAGHMVPYDQPEAALDLFTRWIMDIPFSSPEARFVEEP